MIAITFALAAESASIVAGLRDKRTARAGAANIIYGKLCGYDVAIFHTGVGRAATERQLDRGLGVINPSFLISSGFAGGVSETLRVGDVIIAKNFSEPAFLQRLDGVRTATLFTVQSVVDGSSERMEIARANGADAVDMETEAIAQACAAR